VIPLGGEHFEHFTTLLGEPEFRPQRQSTVPCMKGFGSIREILTSHRGE
jgi:hypothetical protein